MYNLPTHQLAHPAPVNLPHLAPPVTVSRRNH